MAEFVLLSVGKIVEYEEMLVTSISHFLTIFSEGIFSQGHGTWGLFGKKLIMIIAKRAISACHLIHILPMVMWESIRQLGRGLMNPSPNDKILDLSHSIAAVSSMQDLRTGGRWFDPWLGQYIF